MVFSVTLLLNKLKSANFFPIKTIRVQGAYRLTDQDIRNSVLPEIEQGFFGINIGAVSDRLSQLPWVAHSFVRKEWPDKLNVIIDEKKPIAIWNGHSLLSEHGEIFSPGQIDPFNPGRVFAGDLERLPRVVAPNGAQIQMIQYFNAIDRLLHPLQAKISLLELTSDSTWKLILTNGIIFYLGQQDILTRLNHFVKVYPKIIGDHAVDVEYVDLRYSNGVAMKWKTTIGMNKHGKEAK